MTYIKRPPLRSGRMLLFVLLVLVLALSSCTVITSPPPDVTSTPTPTKEVVKPAVTLTLAKADIVLKEADLKQSVQDALVQQNEEILSNVYFDLQPGKMIFGGRAKLGLLPSLFEVTAILPVVKGKPEPKIMFVKLNGVEAGYSLRTQVKDMIQPYLDQLVQTNANLYVDKINITDNEILIFAQHL